MKKKNNLNKIFEEIVNQYLGDFSLEKNKEEDIIEKPIIENKKLKKEIVQDKIEETREIKENKNEAIAEDHQLMLESLKEEFFTMLNTTKKIEEKKDLSDELENIAKTFFN